MSHYRTQSGRMVADSSERIDRIVRFLESHDGQRVAICAYSVLATLVLLAYPGTAAALAIGIPYLFFVPGFAVVRLVFWRNTSIEAKFVLSMGLSILVVILLGLFLVLTPIGLNSDTTRASMIAFSLGAVALEVFVWPANRWDQEAEAEEREEKGEPFKVDKVVAAMLGTALVVSAISLGLIITAEYPSRTYYAMTDEWGSANINTTYDVGSNLTLVIEMHNGEDGVRVFSLNAFGANNSTVFAGQWFNNTLESGDTWNVSVTFQLDTPGVFRLVFMLYIQQEGYAPYLYSENPVQLWVEVIG
ncbi:MAG: DUF1616 domain-containing protein [Methanobacteriota archaeon]|nr:MAG: DUF1616 domain-containing protein [Euryarchaeota archaeon]